MTGHTVFVTGADGFIGSHVTEVLIQRGHRVRALAWYNARGSYGWLEDLRPDLASQVEMRLGDVTDRSFVEACMDGVDGVINLAALIGIPYSFAAAESYVDVNIGGVMHLLEAAKRMRLKKFVQLSTSEVYGNAESFPIAETAAMHPQSPYAATKVASDQLALAYFRAFEVPVAVARPFNTFGPRQSARAVIPTVMTQLLVGGDDCRLRLGDVDTKREFCFVRDTAEGIVAIYEAAPAVGEVINIGSGFEISIRSMAALAAEILGKTLMIESDPARLRPGNSEITRLLSDTCKAKALLGWTAKYLGMDGFRRGMEEFADWLKQPGRLADYKSNLYVV